MAFLLACATSATAQETSGSVVGRVTGPAGSGEPAVTVSASGEHLQGNRVVVTAADGGFRFLSLPPGEYTLRFERIGRRTVVVEHVRVELGRATGLTAVRLEEQAVVLDPLVVNARALALDPINTDIGARVEATDYAQLPGLREYTAILETLPHTGHSHRGDPLNVAGATGLENMYFIDGVNVTAVHTAQSGTSLPYNFVRAVEMKTGGYQAEHGRGLGAIVNAVTHTGTNDFEVDVFGYGTTSDLSATPRALAALRESDSYSVDVGARVSGPLRRDVLWYSLAYNPRIDRAQREVAGFGDFEDERVAHVFASKLTWQARPALEVELSLFGDPVRHEQVAPPFFAAGYTPLSSSAYLRNARSGGFVGTLRARSALRPGLVVEGSLSRASGEDSNESQSAEPVLFDDLDGTVTGSWLPFVMEFERLAGTLKVTADPGPHLLTAGIELEENTLFRIAESSVTRRSDTSLFVETVQGGRGDFVNRIPTLYVQDSWQVGPGLTLNGGVRWSRQTMIGASGLVAQRFGSEWQPRVGFVWMPGRGVQRLFGSVGRYHQQLPLNLSSLWHLDYAYTVSFYSSDPRAEGVTPDSTQSYPTLEEDFRNFPDVRAEHLDEAVLGYERLVGRSARLTARLVRRELRAAWGQGFDPSAPTGWVLGRIGSGALSFLPDPIREYTAFDVTLEGEWGPVELRSSYVLSRNYGNYPGLAQQDYGFLNPGTNLSLLTREQGANSTGPLPNDRTHVFKLTAAMELPAGFGLGSFVTVASGTPRSELAAGSMPGFQFARVHTVPRGQERTPGVWDLSLRLRYRAPFDSPRATLLLDVLHIGNPQTETFVDELRYRTNTDGVLSNPNPNFGSGIAFQSPATTRFGLEVTF